MDVIPPFDKYVASPDVDSSVGQPVPPADDSDAGLEPSAAQSCPASNNEGGSEGYFTPSVPDVTAAPLSPEDAEIPAYDLAENILAEQRRAAGRRRRGPGRVEEPVVLPRGSDVRLSAPDFATQDLLELQRVVAEIVAKDIERLCRRPARPVAARG